MTPLEQLAEALSKKVAPPFDWTVEHAADGSIQRLWNASDDAVVMLRVVGRWPNRQRVALAACACIRTVLRNDPTNRSAAAVAAVEKWARGKADAEYVKRFRELVNAAATMSNTSALVVGYAAEFVSSFVAYGGGFAAQAVGAAAASPAHRAHANTGYEWQAVRSATLARFAKIVRKVIPVAPTLAELMP